MSIFIHRGGGGNQFVRIGLVSISTDKYVDACLKLNRGLGREEKNEFLEGLRDLEVKFGPLLDSMCFYELM